MLDLWRSCRWSYGDRKLWDIDTWEYLIHIWSFVQHGTPTESAWHDWWYRGCFDAGGRPHATSFPQVIAMAASFNRCGRPRCCWKKAFEALIKTLLILASHLEILTRLWGWTHPLELPKWNVKKTCSLWTSGRLVTAVNLLVPGVCSAWWVKRWDVKHGTCRMSASCGATTWVWALKWQCICRRDVTTNAG